MNKHKRQYIPEGIKKIVAGNQRYKCANNPTITLEGLENYKCPMWLTDGSFDAAGYEIDHIVEVSIGGYNDISNLQALCPSCHSVKTKHFISANSSWNLANDNEIINDDFDDMNCTKSIIQKSVKEKSIKERIIKTKVTTTKNIKKHIVINKNELHNAKPKKNAIDSADFNNKLLQWFAKEYELSFDKNDIVKIKDIHDIFKIDDWFYSLLKSDRRKYNYTYFTDFFSDNTITRKYYKERYQKNGKETCNVLCGYKKIQIDNDKNNEDCTFIDTNGIGGSPNIANSSNSLDA